MVFGGGGERYSHGRRSDIQRPIQLCYKPRLSVYEPPESKMLEAHHLRSLLNSQDDESLRKADNKLITALTNLQKTQPNVEISKHLSKIETKQRIEDLDIMKPSKLHIPLVLLPGDRNVLETKLRDLESSGELMESHPASELIEQAEEIVTETKKTRGRPKKLGVIYLDNPSGKPATTMKTSYKRQLSKSLLDNVKTAIESDSNSMMKTSDQSRLKNVVNWLVTYFPQNKNEIDNFAKRLVDQIVPIVASHKPNEDSKTTVERMKIPALVLESLNSIFSDPEIHIPKALSRLRAIRC